MSGAGRGLARAARAGWMAGALALALVGWTPWARASAPPPPRCGSVPSEVLAHARDVLVAAVREQLPAGAELELRRLSATGCRTTRVSYVRAEVTPQVPRLLGTSAMARVCLRDDAGGSVAELWLKAELVVRRPVVVAARDLAPGTTLGPDDVEVLLRPTTGGEQPFATPDEVLGCVARGEIATGTPVTPAHVTRPVLVRRGAVVRATIRSGALVVSNSGVARQDGRLGDTIRVESADGGHSFRGRVAGPDLVELVP